MILSPDDERSLQVIDRELTAVAPHLAGMLRTFNRLHAHDAAPPAEDAVALVPLPSGPAPGYRSRWRRRVRAGAGDWPGATMRRWPARRGPAGTRGPAGVRRSRQGVLRPMAAIAVPMVLLVTLVLVVVFGLGSSIRCRPVPAAAPAARRTTSLPVPAGSGFVACPTPARPGTRAGTATGAGLSQ